MENLLVKAGLTLGESKVYSSLLELGQSSITSIISKSRVSTSKSYDILNRLKEKGLVSQVSISGVKYFKATNPNRIIEILESKKEETELALIQVKNIIPDLITKYHSKESEEEAEVYIGIKGLITVFNEETEWMKKTRKPSLVIGITKGGKTGKDLDDYFARLQKKRDKLRLKTYFIFNKKEKGNFPYLEKSKYCRIKYLKVGSEMVSANLFSNKTVFSIYAKQPFLLVIKSKDLTDEFRSYFKQLWKVTKS